MQENVWKVVESILSLVQTLVLAYIYDVFQSNKAIKECHNPHIVW